MALHFVISITGLIIFAGDADCSKKQNFSPHEQSFPLEPQQFRLNADIVSLASQILQPFLLSSPDGSVSFQNLPREPIHLSFDRSVFTSHPKRSNNPQTHQDSTFARNLQESSSKLGNQGVSHMPSTKQFSSNKPSPDPQKRGFHLETVPLQHQFSPKFPEDFTSSRSSYELRNQSSSSRKYLPVDVPMFAASSSTKVRESVNVPYSQVGTTFQNQETHPNRHSTRFRPLQSNFDVRPSNEKLISVSRRPSPSNQNINKNVGRAPRTSHISVQNDHTTSHTTNSHVRTNLGSFQTSDAKFGPMLVHDTLNSKAIQHYLYPEDKDQSGRRYLIFRAPTLITTPRPLSAPFTVDNNEKNAERKPVLPKFEETIHEDTFYSSGKEKLQPTAPTIVVQRPNTPAIVIDVVTLHNIHTDGVEKAIKDLNTQPHSHSNADHGSVVFETNPESLNSDTRENNHNYHSESFEDTSNSKEMPPPSSFTPEYSPEIPQDVWHGSTTPLPPVTPAFNHHGQQNHHQLESNPYELHIAPFSNTLTSTKPPKVRAKPKLVSGRTSAKRKSQHIPFLPQGGSFGSENVPGQPGSDYPIFNEIPFTNFDCREFQKPGFYADVEAGCQVFHNCDMGMKKHSFICPNGTIFHQQLFICDWWYNVRCDESPDFFNLNAGLYLETSSSDERQKKSENHKRNNKRAEN